MNIRVMKVIKKGLYSKVCILTSRNKMGDFIRYFIEEMTKEAIEMPCSVIMNILKNVPGVQGVDVVVSIGPRYLTFLPDRLRTKEMCNEAVRNNPYTLKYVPDQYRTQEMCNEAVEVDPWLLKYVPDHFKIQKNVL